MKRLFTLTTSVAVLLSMAAPAFARDNTTMTEKLSRRLIRSESILRQRLPDTAMPVNILLREREQAQQGATGRSLLPSASGVRTVKGVGADAAGESDNRPSRRSIKDAADESALPSSLVQTGIDRRTVKIVLKGRLSRRLVIQNARKANVVQIAPLGPPTLLPPPPPPAPTPPPPPPTPPADNTESE